MRFILHDFVDILRLYAPLYVQLYCVLSSRGLWILSGAAVHVSRRLLLRSYNTMLSQNLDATLPLAIGRSDNVASPTDAHGFRMVNQATVYSF